MNTALILEAVGRHIELSQKEMEFFISLLQEKKLKKRQFFLHENEVCKYSAFVIKGCLRSYIIDRNGFEHILQFAPPGWWIADMASVVSGLPGKLNIDALEESDVLLFGREDQQTLFKKVPKFERFFRIITENSVVAANNRLLDYMSLSAQQRYDLFCKRYPTLMQTLPQKQIASYIGVTPEFLSKMKSELLRQKKKAA